MTKKPVIDELNVFHPYVESWLLQNEYQILGHEVKAPIGGRIDFLVKDKDGALWVVECKVEHGATVRRSVLQAFDYAKQYKNAHAMVIIPEGGDFSRIKQACDEYGVWFQTIPVNVETLLTDQLEINSETRFYSHMRGLSLMMDLGMHDHDNRALRHIIFGMHSEIKTRREFLQERQSFAKVISTLTLEIKSCIGFSITTNQAIAFATEQSPASLGRFLIKIAHPKLSLHDHETLLATLLGGVQ